MPSTEAEALGADEWALLDLPDIPAVPASSEPAGSVITYELFARPHLLSFAAQLASGRPLASRSSQPAGGGGGGGNRSGGSGGTGGGGGAGAEGGTGSGIDETRVETALFPTEPATLDVAEDLGPGGSSDSWPQSDPSASTAHFAMLSSNGRLPAWIAPQVSSPWFAHSFETARAGRTERGGASAAGDWDPYAGISRLLPYFAAANPESAPTGVAGLSDPDFAAGSAESPLAEAGPSALLLLLPDEPHADAAMLLAPPAAAVSEGNVPEPASILMVALAASVLLAWKFRR